ncbi:MAG: hypothetical protein VKK97_07450 [Synechococcaceae cyanobacterium]|nr:hypothetical protein [Synechococcaceae cyanobacterium]
MIGDTGVLPAQLALVDRLLREKSPPAPVPPLELAELPLPA